MTTASRTGSSSLDLSVTLILISSPTHSLSTSMLISLHPCRKMIVVVVVVVGMVVVAGIVVLEGNVVLPVCGIVVVADGTVVVEGIVDVPIP